MARIKAYHALEHAFVHEAGKDPQVLNGDAVIVAQTDIADTDLKRTLVRAQQGAVLEVSDRDAEKLRSLKDADGHPYAGDENSEIPKGVFEATAQPYDQAKADSERTPREEAERIAAEAGHTPEGEITDHEKHVDFAEANKIDAGGPAAAVHEARKRGRGERPAAAATAPQSRPLGSGGIPPGALASPSQPLPSVPGALPPGGASAQPQPPFQPQPTGPNVGPAALQQGAPAGAAPQPGPKPAPAR